MSEANKVEQIEHIPIRKIHGFVARTGKNTRQAIPVLTAMGYYFFPSELSPDLLAERNERDEGGKLKQAFLGQKKETHPYGIVLWDMVYGENADEKSKKFFIKIFRDHQPAIHSISVSIYKLGQRDPIEVSVDEDGYKLVDGFVRTVSCIMRDLLAEISNGKPHGTVRAQVVNETKVDDLEDLSFQKNMMRLELKKSDLARRFYEMSLVGRVDDEEEVVEEEGGKKKRKRKRKELSDQTISDRCGLPKEGGRQKVFQFRTIYEYCMKHPKGQQFLVGWDAGEITLKEMLDKAQASEKNGDGEGPKPKKTTRPRCLSYPKAYQLFKNQEALAKVAETMYPELPIDAKMALIRYGLKVVMQQADKEDPEVPLTEPATDKDEAA
jgi:hypothetical protein